MNILYTAYYGLGIGGAEVSMNLLARALEKKHNIIVSSSGEYKGFRNYKFSKYIKYVPSFYLQNKYLSNFFSEIIKKENIHVIHSHDSRTAIAAIMAAKKNNVRVVNHYRDYWFCCPRSSLLRPDLVNCNNCNIENLKKCSSKTRFFWNLYKLDYTNKIRTVLKSADVKIAISNAVKDKLDIIGVYDAFVVRNPVDLKLFREYANNEKHNLSETAIGYVGSLSYNKGLQKLSKVMSSVLNKHKKASFIITGDGELKYQLKKELDVFDERVIFNDKLSYNGMVKLYKSFDIVLIPSVWQEPFSRVAIEAMAAGKPIIASNVGGLKDIIKKNFGFLINANDYDEWERTIELLINTPIKRRLMGINALKEAKNYDVNAVAEEIDKMYANLK